MKHKLLKAALASVTVFSQQMLPISQSMPIAANTAAAPLADEGEVQWSAKTVLDAVKTVPPTLSEDGSSIVLPASPSEGYKVELYGSSNEAIIGMDGSVTKPIEDMEVSVMYRVVSVTDPEETAVDQAAEASIVIDGLYEATALDQARPATMPAIQEWKGGSGVLQLSSAPVLAADASVSASAAATFQRYFSRINGIDLSLEEAESQTRISLQVDPALSSMPAGFYTVEIGSDITIKAADDLGIEYAGATLSQIARQSLSRAELPQGIIRDYPAYESRSIMIDVARFYMPLEYLDEIVDYIAYFKMNEFHCHINDNGGEQNAAFRVESKLFPEINSSLNPDEVYSQEAYRDFQKRAASRGVKVITEIDSPAHSAFVALHDASLMKDSSHINVSNPDAVEFMKSLFDEFLDGEDPVFQGDEFNIGIDEYPKAESEAVRAYINELIEHVSSKGRHTRMWASLGDAGFKGTTPVSNDATALFWNNAWASFDQMLDAGYSCVTTPNFMYVVPGDPVNGHNDFLNMEASYNTWDTNHLSGCWLWGSLGSSYVIAKSNPLLRGANGACWHDVKCGMSPEDSFARIQNLVGLFSEKTWLGTPRDNQDGAEFAARWDALKDLAVVSPARRIDSKTDMLASYDFEAFENGILKDLSGNSHDAAVNGMQLTDSNGSKAGVLDGTSSISLPFERLGFPYNVSFDLYLDENTPANAVLFDGPDGQIVANFNGTGTLAYTRRNYTFVIPCQLPVNTWMNLKLSCDTEGLSLYLNDVYAGTGQYDGTPAKYQKSSTINLQTASIGSASEGNSGVIGMIDNLQISLSALSQTEMSGLDSIGYGNIALNKPTTCNGIYGNGSYAHIQQAFLNDGDPTTRAQFAQAADAWMIMDLGEEQCIDRIVMNWHNAPEKYEVLVSSDGENWTKVYTSIDCKSGPGNTDEIQFDQIVKARYVKYQQIRMFKASNNVFYSGSIYEMEVYGFAASHLALTEQCGQAIASTAVTEENQAFLNVFSRNVTLAKSLLNHCTVQEAGILQVFLSESLAALQNGNFAIPSADASALQTLVENRADETRYLTDGYNQYAIYYKAALRTFFDPFSSQEDISSITKQLSDAKAKLEEKAAMQVSSNKKARSDGAFANILNGSADSFVRLEGNQTAGDYIQIEMRDAIDLDSLKIVCDPAGTEIPASASVEISADGRAYTQIGTMAEVSELEIEILPASTRFIRIVLNEPASKPWKITQILINQGEIADTTLLESLVENPVVFDAYTDSSWTAYQQALAFGQSVLAKERKNQPEVEEAVSRIQTAIAGLEKIGDLDGLKTVIDTAAKKAAGDYTRYSLEKLTAALDAANAVYAKGSDASQNTVNKVLDALNAALAALRENAGSVDSYVLEGLLDETVNEHATSANAFAAYQSAKEQAKTLMSNPARTQKKVDLAAEKLQRIASTLPERTKVNAALNKPVSASGVYGNGVHAHLVLENVNDGSLKTRTQFNQIDDSWMIIDLEDVYEIDEIKASWFNAPAQYEMQISIDGETWTTVAAPPAREGGPKATDDMNLDGFMSARYVKYQQKKMFQSAANGVWYSGSPYEIEVFAKDGSLYTSELSYWIAQAENAQASSYSKENWTVLQQALEAANAAVSASSQEEIDAAQMALESAVLAVKGADKTLLAYAVDYAAAIEANDGLNDVNAKVAAIFTQRLADARAILANTDASQEEVNAAWSALTQIIHMIGFTSDFTELDLLIARAESLDLSQYEVEGAAALIEALDYAKTVRQDPNALSDVSIAQAVSRLQAALDELTPIAPVEIDTTLLALLVETVEGTDLSKYVEKGQAEFTAALIGAKAVLASPESQQQVDHAVSELHSAWMNLRRKPNEDDLKALQNFLQEVKNLDASRYEKKTFAEIQSLVKEIGRIVTLNDPEESDVRTGLALMDQAKALMQQTIDAAFEPAASSVSSSVKTAARTAPLFHMSLASLAAAALMLLKRKKK